jgi:dihydropteroate synthase
MRHTQIMGILNVTPDSFSDGGRFERENIVEVARQMQRDGASILDLGGESTGPGSQDLSLQDELSRVLPALKRLRLALPDMILSVDTWKSEVARAALEAGANWINDVTAGRGDPRIFEVAAEYGAPLVLMYSKDDSARTKRDSVEYDDVMRTVKSFLKERIALARKAGVSEIIVDPGMGFFVSGNPRYSWELIERIEELYELDCPILVGTSRKSFLLDDRFGGTLLTTQMLRGRVDILRVHDVFENATAVSLG